MKLFRIPTFRPPTLILFTILILASLQACNGSKAFVKRGAKMEKAGFADQAADLYYTAVVKKPTNPDALAGLKRTGQIVLGKHIATFDESVAYNLRESALEAWHDAEAWDEKLEGVGVDLAFPEAKRVTYDMVKNAHLDESYRKANILLEKEMFDEALKEFDAILLLNPNYRDAPERRNVAFCEPRFRIGVHAQERERFREAHAAFDELVSTDSDYKDAAQRLSDILEAGQYTVALLDFKNGSSQLNMEIKIQSMVEQALMNSKDPFLKVVDRESLALILQEQTLGMNGLTSGGDVEIGNMLGAKALLKATITTCDHRQTGMTSSYQTGYEQFKVERVNEKGKKYFETKYRQVQYREFTQEASVDMTCTFKFISTTTGEVISSNTISSHASDNIRYITYGGNQAKFYLARQFGNGPDLNGRKKRDRLLSSRQAIRSAEALTVDAGLDLASQIQSSIEQELLTLVP